MNCAIDTAEDAEDHRELAAARAEGSYPPWD